MSVEYTKPTENLTARACKITIDQTRVDEPYIIFNYTNDKEDLGKIVITPTQIVEQGIT